MRQCKKSNADTAVVLTVVMDGDRVLMIKKRNDEVLSWVFPGGKVEPGEDARDAAKRELYEEVGLKCDVSRLIGTRIHPDTAKEVSYFLCRAMGRDAENREPDKVEKFAWMTLDEVEKNISTNLFAPVRDEISRISEKVSNKQAARFRSMSKARLAGTAS